jgi:hypothetical protein
MLLKNILECKMKTEKFDKLVNEVEEYIAARGLCNPHYLFDKEIIEVFSDVKKKHVKKAIEMVR